MNNAHNPFSPNLESDLSGENLISGTAPKLRSVTDSVPNKSDSYSVGTIDESMLTEEERAVVERYASIKEVIRIHEQGAAKREQAQEELVRIEAELKQAMLDSSC